MNIALDLPLNKYFSYSNLTNLPVGTRVLVEFKQKQVVGFVWQSQTSTQNTIKPHKLKPILQVYPEVLDPSIVALIQFTADYYHYPIGQSIFVAIPSLLRKPILSSISPIKMPKKILKSIVKVTLNQEQKEAVDKIKACFNTFHPAILFGVTGSGKTEVYLEIIEDIILQGRQALVLVPEINLTPQLLLRFKQRFPETLIHILTSSASAKNRLAGYMGAQTGAIQIIVGTRLALFTPFKNLGIIIIDEEHDNSFKQQDSLKYSARDLAIWRASYLKIPIILGSATPSLESLYNFKLNKYSLYSLVNRGVTGAQLPKIKLIDLNTNPINQCFTNIALEQLKQCYARNEISLVFINRRGYSPIISCYNCGWVSTCKYCSINMVHHKAKRELKCHHCGFSVIVPKSCIKCSSSYLQAIGEGTQKIEEVLAQEIPSARIFRIDQDTTNSKKAWDELYYKIHNNEVDILVGTQMLVKGHDFHNLTLVVGLNLDNGLYSHDFRASELLFNQLTQVAGRSGRGDKSGLVLLQTRYPTHDLYQYLIKHDFIGFVNYLMNERKKLNLPPYSYYVLLRASAKTINLAMDFLIQVSKLSQGLTSKDVKIYAPVPAMLKRLKNQERAQILIQSNDRNLLHKFLDKLVIEIDKIRGFTKVSWQLDVDPREL